MADPSEEYMLQDRCYYLPRDFEYAQILYDLAFLLEIDALVLNQAPPKYRIFSLFNAAQGIDGYSSDIALWLKGSLKDNDLAYLPSSRIKKYLKSIDAIGTIDELNELLKKTGYFRCLRLRSLRGLGKTRIAESVTMTSPSEQWLADASVSTGLSKDAILSIINDKIPHSWQTPHVIPPLLRLLHDVEDLSETRLRYSLDGIKSVFEPIVSEVSVRIAAETPTQIERLVRKALKGQKMFTEKPSNNKGGICIVHRMGWSAFIYDECDTGVYSSIENIARSFDPLSLAPSGLLKGDLHVHSAWSDGISSISSIVEAGSALGYEYIAITDHSRSSKIQGGLTPAEWLQQAGSIAKQKPAISVLHGIEVDILKDGELDLPLNILNAADIVVASVHSGWSSDQVENTRRLLSAIESGAIDVLGHPTAAIIGKPGKPDYVRPPIKAEWPKIFERCAKWKVALEFNCFPSRFDLSPTLARQALAAGCWISLGSDSHSVSHLQHLLFGERVVEEIKENRFLNLLSCDELKEWLREAREVRAMLPKSVSRKQPELDLADTSTTGCIISATLGKPEEIPDGSRVIGLDLTASAKKATGVALLDGKQVQTCSIDTDDELLAYIRKHQPRIVSIDSPLGLPGGGAEIKKSAGIVRLAESDLASIGIPAYPALIDSMKPLTLRGIALKQKIESLHPAPVVIESYPGAAQDILALPRKQRGLELLREGLRGIGLNGPGLDAKSHDEIDAITSALVGRFYESSNYIPMGMPSESELIVPAMRPLLFESPLIICLAGKTGAGKSTVARYLSVFYGLKWLKTRELIRELLIDDATASQGERLFNRVVDPQNITEADLREFGGVVLRKYKQKPLRMKLTAKIINAENSLVIDSVRAYSDIDWSALSEAHPIIWLIDCDEKTLQSRLINRSKHGVKKPTTASPVDAGVAELIPRADLKIVNNASLEALRWAVDDTLFFHVKITRESL